MADVSPSQSSVKNVFIRGSVVRYVHLPAAAVDTPLLQDATRRGTNTAFPTFTAGSLTCCVMNRGIAGRREGEARLRRATCAPQNKANSTWLHDRTMDRRGKPRYAATRSRAGDGVAFTARGQPCSTRPRHGPAATTVRVQRPKGRARHLLSSHLLYVA